MEIEYRNSVRTVATSFEDLEVYRLACRLADVVWASVGSWTPFERDTIGKQLARAADSVAANIAEGDGRSSEVEFRRFLYIARGSLYEATHWIATAKRRGLFDPAEVSVLDPLLAELLPRLNALIRTINRRANELRETTALYGQSSTDSFDPDLQ